MYRGTNPPEPWGAVPSPGFTLPQTPYQLEARQKVNESNNHGLDYISIDELQALAIANNPELSRMYYKIQAAQGERVQSGLYPNPSLVIDSVEMGNDRAGGMQEIGIEQEIVTSHKIGLDSCIAQRSWEVTKQQYALSVLAIKNEVKIRAYEVLAAQQTVQFREQLLQIEDEAVRVAEKMYEARETSLIDMIQTRNKRNRTALELKEAKNNEVLNWQRLTMVLGVPDFPDRQITDSLEIFAQEMDWSAVWSRLLASSPELTLAQNKVRVAQSVLQRARAERTPNVTVGAGVGYDNSTNDTYANIGVNLPIQIYNRNQGNIQKALAELAAAQREIDVQKLLLQERLADVFNRYKNAKQSVEMCKESLLSDSETALNLCLKGYKKGEVSYIELLSAEESFIEAKNQYIFSLKELCISVALIDGLLLQRGVGSSTE